MANLQHQAVSHKSSPPLLPQDPTQSRYEHSYVPPSEKYYKTSNDEPALLLPVIDGTAYSILTCLRSHLNAKSGQCDPSIATIARELGMASSTIKANLDYLYQARIVRRVRRRLQHSRRGKVTVQNVSNQYILLARSQWALDKVTRPRAKKSHPHSTPILVEDWGADETDPITAKDQVAHKEATPRIDCGAAQHPAASTSSTPAAASESGCGQAQDAPLSPERSALLEQVLAAGVKVSTARALLASNTPSIIYLQLDYLSDREPRDRAATLVKSIRENWSPPAKYLQRVEVVEAAQQEEARQVSAAQSARQRRVEVSKRAQQQLQGETVAAELEAQWQVLDEATRVQIEQAARQRLGVLARSGTCAGALQAMRRTLMREMQEDGHLTGVQGNAGVGGPGRLEV